MVSPPAPARLPRQEVPGVGASTLYSESRCVSWEAQLAPEWPWNSRLEVRAQGDQPCLPGPGAPRGYSPAPPLAGSAGACPAELAAVTHRKETISPSPALQSAELTVLRPSPNGLQPPSQGHSTPVSPQPRPSHTAVPKQKNNPPETSWLRSPARQAPVSVLAPSLDAEPVRPGLHSLPSHPHPPGHGAAGDSSPLEPLSHQDPKPMSPPAGVTETRSKSTDSHTTVAGVQRANFYSCCCWRTTVSDADMRHRTGSDITADFRQATASDRFSFTAAGTHFPIAT